MAATTHVHAAAVKNINSAAENNDKKDTFEHDEVTPKKLEQKSNDWEVGSNAGRCLFWLWRQSQISDICLKFYPISCYNKHIVSIATSHAMHRV